MAAAALAPRLCWQMICLAAEEQQWSRCYAVEKLVAGISIRKQDFGPKGALLAAEKRCRSHNGTR